MATILERRNREGQRIGYQVKIRRNGYPNVSKTFERKTDAIRWGIEIESEISRGVFVDRSEAQRNTLRDILERYRDEVSPTKRSNGREASMINVILRRPELVDSKISALTPKQFAEWRNSLSAAAYAPATIVRLMNLVSSIINHARREWGVNVADNVASAKLVSRPKGADRKRDRRLQEGEEAALFDALSRQKHADYLVPLARLAIETAARQGELCSLEWRDVDVQRRVMRVRGLSGEGSKNGEERDVPLSSAAVAAFKSIPVRDRIPLVFRDQMTLRLAWQRAVKSAKIEDLTFHDLRHEAISRLAAIYTNPLELMRITGHSTFSMLSRYYHADIADLAKKLA